MTKAMMMKNETAFFRVQTVQGKNAAQICSRHNLREIQAELGADSHINATLSVSNLIIHGVATSVVVIEAEKKILMDAKLILPMRKNQLRLIEIVVTISRTSTVYQQAYFNDCWQWGEEYYGISCISAVIHKDESVPNAHALYVPCADGRMMGSALVGGREKIREAQRDCMEKVGNLYGLKSPEGQKRTPLAERRKMVDMILKALSTKPQLLNDPVVKDTLTDILLPSPKAVFDAIKSPIGNYQPFSEHPNDEQSAPHKDHQNIHSLACVGNYRSEPISHPEMTPICHVNLMFGNLVGDSKI